MESEPLRQAVDAGENFPPSAKIHDVRGGELVIGPCAAIPTTPHMQPQLLRQIQLHLPRKWSRATKASARRPDWDGTRGRATWPPAAPHTYTYVRAYHMGGGGLGFVLFFGMLGCGGGESRQPLGFWRLAPGLGYVVRFPCFFPPSLACLPPLFLSLCFFHFVMRVCIYLDALIIVARVLYDVDCWLLIGLGDLTFSLHFVCAYYENHVYMF